MDPETYLAQSVFPSLLNGWSDTFTIEGEAGAPDRDVTVQRKVLFCPDVVTLEDQRNTDQERDLLLIYTFTGEGDAVQDLQETTYGTQEVDLMAVAPTNNILYRFRRHVEGLVYAQPDEDRLVLAQNPQRGYNDDLRGYTVLWSGVIRA